MPISLVTGGAGFIGAHVVKELVSLGHQVVVLDDLSGGFRDNVPSEAVLVEGSITDHTLVDSLFAEHRFQFVYHLAAYAAEGLSHFIKRYNYTNNLLGSVNLINAAVRHKTSCFVFTSSIAVYGTQPQAVCEEVTPRPEDPYGIAKLAVEQDLRVTHEIFGLDYIIFRPHNVYGEFQNIGDRYRNVVGIFMNQLLQGKPMTVFGDGGQTRAFSYVADVAPYIARSVDIRGARNQIFNIGADREYTITALAEATMKAMGVLGDIRRLAPRKEVLHASARHDKAELVFGIRRTVPLEDGLRRMADWVRQVGVRKTKRFEAIELYDRLPPVWLED